MAGIPEFMAAFVLLTGMGGDHAPSTASLSEVQHYAPNDTNYSVFLDAKSMIQPSVTKLESLVKTPMVIDILGPEQARQTSDGITMARTMAKSAIGMDPVNDLHWVSVWLKFDAKKGPQWLIAAKGNWPSGLLKKLSERAGGALETVHGQTLWRAPEGGLTMARGKNDTMLLSNAPWLPARLSKRWVPAKIEGAVQELFKNKPNLVLYSKPSAASGNFIKNWMTGPATLIRWPLLTHRRFGVALTHVGFNAYWEGTNADSVRRAKLTFDGGISLLRAIHHGASGLGKLVLAWLPKKSKNPALAALHKYGDKLFDLLNVDGGDADFTADVQVDNKRKVVTASAQGKSLTQVLPFGGFSLLMGLTYMVRPDEVSGEPENGHYKSKSGKILVLPKNTPARPVITK